MLPKENIGDQNDNTHWFTCMINLLGIYTNIQEKAGECFNFKLGELPYHIKIF